MAMFDKLKALRSTKKPEHGEEPPEALPAPDAEAGVEAASGPSRVMRGALSAAASTVLSGSKKAADLVLSRYRPTLMLDAILDPTAIRSLVDNRDVHTNIPRKDLVLLCTNTLETLELAESIRAELEPNDEDEGRTTEEAPQAIEPLDTIIRAVKALTAGENEEAVTLAQQLAAEDPTFAHPLLSRTVALCLHDRRAAPEDVLVWCKRALRASPLDEQLLGVAVELSEEEQQRVYGQMLAAAQRESAALRSAAEAKQQPS